MGSGVGRALSLHKKGLEHGSRGQVGGDRGPGRLEVSRIGHLVSRSQADHGARQPGRQ